MEVNGYEIDSRAFRGHQDPDIHNQRCKLHAHMYFSTKKRLNTWVDFSGKLFFVKNPGAVANYRLQKLEKQPRVTVTNYDLYIG